MSISSDTTAAGAGGNLGLVPAAATPGSITLNGGTLAITQSLALHPNRGIALGTNGGSIDAVLGTTLTYNGIIANAPSQSGGLSLIDTGEVDLGSANTYSGGTSVNAGTLGITNTTGSATGSGTTTVAAAATLAGTGHITGPSIINGHLSPGLGFASLGTLHLGPTTLSTGSNLDYDLLAPLNSDLTTTGALNLGTNINVNIDAEAGFALGSYILVSSTGLTGNPTYTLTHQGSGDNAALIYNVATVGNNIVLNVDAVAQKWTGAAGSGGNGTWDTTSANWTPTVNGGIYADNQFKQVFDDTGTNTNITIDSTNGSVSPLALVFSNNTVPYTLSGQQITGNASVLIQGPGTVTLSSSNSYGGGTTLMGGLLNIGDPQAIGSGQFTIAGGKIDNTNGAAISMGLNNPQIWAGSFTFVGSNVDNSHDLNLGTGSVTLTTTPTITVSGSASTLTVGGVIDDAGCGFGLTKDGPGTLALSGANTYSGPTTVLAGNLNVTPGGTLGGGSAPLTVSTSGIVDLGNNILNVGAVIVTAGTIQNGTLSAPSFAINNSGTVTISASLAGSGGLSKTLAGTTILSGANAYTGATTISDGTLRISADNNLGAAPGVATPGSLTINGATLAATASFSLNSNRGAAIGSSGATIDIAPGAVVSYGGVMADAPSQSGTLIKIDTGELDFGGSNTYSGGTTVSAGTLGVTNVSGSGTGTGSVLISSGAILAGTGRISGSVNLSGHLAPGSAPMELARCTSRRRP